MTHSDTLARCLLLKLLRILLPLLLFTLLSHLLAHNPELASCSCCCCGDDSARSDFALGHFLLGEWWVFVFVLKSYLANAEQGGLWDSILT